MGETMLKRIHGVLLSAIVASAAFGGPAAAARSNSVRVSGPGSASNDSDLQLPDPHKTLRHMSKDLKLKKDQRVGVSFILQERTREIRLLLDIDTLSQESRNALAAKVMGDTDAQIETLLKSKQKRKFDKELAKSHEVR